MGLQVWRGHWPEPTGEHANKEALVCNFTEPAAGHTPPPNKHSITFNGITGITVREPDSANKDYATATGDLPAQVGKYFMTPREPGDWKLMEIKHDFRNANDKVVRTGTFETTNPAKTATIEVTIYVSNTGDQGLGM